MMPNLPISQLPSVGNTGYTESDILVFVNYQIETGTTSNTPLSQVKEWVLSGLSENYLPLSGGTVSGDTIFQSGLTATTISATTYLNLPGEVKKIVLRKVDLGSKAVLGNLDIPGLAAHLSKILDNREIFDILSKSSYNGVKVDYYFSFDDPSDFIRKKTIYTTQTVGVDYDSQLAFSGISNFIYNNSISSYVNFYVEVYISSDINYFAPTQIKLVNPLYSSLNPNKYSYTKSYTGEHEFIRNNNQSFLSPYNKNVNTIYSDFLRPDIVSYYSATTSQDIPKKISDIVANPNFYGPLSANSNTVINVAPWDYNVKNIVKNSVFVEPISNFYSKFKIPVNLYGFYNVNQFKLNNFYGDRMYNIGGLSPLIFSANANTNVYSSNTVAQFIDTYRIYPKGNYGYIFANSSPENETNLNNLNYSVGSNRELKYISKDMLRTDWGSYLQVLPGFNETYALKLDFSGSPTLLDSNQFLIDVFNNYAIVNDYSVKKNNQFWNNIITHSTDDLYSGISQGKQIVVTASTFDGITVGGDFRYFNGLNSNFISELTTGGTKNTSYNFGNLFGSTNAPGFNNPVRCIANQSDGKILLGGIFTSYASLSTTSSLDFIVRLSRDGVVDTTFNDGGAGFDSSVFSIAIQNDGKILCGGQFASYTDITGTYNCQYIARLNSDGTFDTTFNNGGIGFNDYVRTIAIQNDGKVLVGGDFFEYSDSGGTFTSQYIARLNSDGTFDQTFNSGGIGFNGDVLTIAIQPSGKILVGGGFYNYEDINGSFYVDKIARLNSDGTLDSSFGSFTNGFNNVVRVIKLQSDGKILVGGDFSSYNGTYVGYSLTRLSSEGVLDTLFKDNVSDGFGDAVHTIETQSDGKILCGGYFTEYNDINGAWTSNYIARINTNGTYDNSFGSTNHGFDNVLSAIAIQSDGKILCGGNFFQYSDNTQLIGSSKIIRIDQNGNIITPYGFDNNIYALEYQSDGKLLVGGYFNSYTESGGSYTSITIIRLNSDKTYDTTFNNNGLGFNDVVYTIAIQSDGKILVGGEFTQYFDDFNTYVCNKIARLNSDGTFDTTFEYGGGIGFSASIIGSGYIKSIVIQNDGKIVCGGRFQQYTDNTATYECERIARLNSDGTFDTTFEYGVDYGFYYVGGKGGNNSYVNSLKIQGDGKILVGGFFEEFIDSTGTYLMNHIARLNSNGTFDTTFNSDGEGFENLNASVLTIAIQVDGKILCGGEFYQYTDNTGIYNCTGIVRLNSNGTFDTTFENGLGIGFADGKSVIFDIKIQPNGKLICGGTFESYTDNTTTYGCVSIARLNSNGTFDASFNNGGTGFDNIVYSIALRFEIFTGETPPDLYMLIQSNDEKMLELSQNPVFTYTSSTESAFEIYAGGAISQYTDTISTYNLGRISNLTSGGTFDTSFMNGYDGFLDSVFAVKTQSDGKLLVGGDFVEYTDSGGTYTCQFITRLNSDGTFDTTFNNGGVGFNSAVNTIAIQSDGKILVGGAFTEYYDNTSTYSCQYIARLNSNGTFDTTFEYGGGTGFNDYVRTIAIQNDGKVLVGGDFFEYTDSVGTFTSQKIARLNSDGTFDQTFNSGGYGFDGFYVRTLAIQNDGKILVGGNFTDYTDSGATYTKTGISRLNTDGTFDDSFGGGGSGFQSNYVNSIAIQPDQKILVGGSFDSYLDSSNHDVYNICRLDSNGYLDGTFINGPGVGPNVEVYTISIQPDGKILCGGSFDTFDDGVNTYYPQYMTRLNLDGSFDPTFINDYYGFDSTVFSIDLFVEEPTIITNTISIDAIYKGHSFRPLIYPLNLTQLLLEVPESFFYDGSTLQQSINSNNNLFEYVGNDIINKKLCLILKYTKLNKYDLVQQNLVITERRNSGNAIKTLMIQNIENAIKTSISNSKAKELRPGSLEVYFGFLDVNTNKLSYIPNYKLIIVKYGDNEIFKIVKDSLDLNMGIL